MLVIHDHNMPVNIFGYIPKVGSKHTCIVDAAVSYDELTKDQVVILWLHQAIEINCLDYQLFCPMQYHMNGFLINKGLKFLAHNPSETMHAIKKILADIPSETMHVIQIMNLLMPPTKLLFL